MLASFHRFGIMPSDGERLKRRQIEAEFHQQRLPEFYLVNYLDR
jgi:hypothetical protein